MSVYYIMFCILLYNGSLSSPVLFTRFVYPWTVIDFDFLIFPAQEALSEFSEKQEMNALEMRWADDTADMRKKILHLGLSSMVGNRSSLPS